MKRPKPRDFGLNSDHAPLSPHGAFDVGLDPKQPLTDQEMQAALDALVVREAIHHRQRAYADALHQYEYNNGWR